jgi:hypothetical protein
MLRTQIVRIPADGVRDLQAFESRVLPLRDASGAQFDLVEVIDVVD